MFDYQLGGAYDEPATFAGPVTIDIVVRDSTESPLPGAYNICYINGFQTQPVDSEFWVNEHPELLLRNHQGEPIIDPNWPDEYILDPSTPQKRTRILAILGPTFVHCAAADFDAIDLDNLDTWQRFPQIKERDAYELVRSYIDLAHQNDLAIAQKNTAELISTPGQPLFFDFAIVESCSVWQECDLYRSAYGDHMLQIEYLDELEDAGMSFAEVCASSDRSALTILRDRNLVPIGEDGYMYAACESNP